MQNNVLVYRVDLYFHDYKQTIEIDENGPSDRSIDLEIKRQETVEIKLGCKFIRIDTEKEEFDTFKAINEICRHIK